LAALQYLGWGWTFDDLAESTAISQEVLCVFFHSFIDFGSTVLYKLYIRPPQTSSDASVHAAEYKIAGFPGAIGPTDATHIMLERVSYRFRQTHMGFKMTHTARTYNITVNHRRQIIATTSGHPARWNDKTLALFDNFMQELHEGDIMDGNRFKLYAYDSNGEVTKQEYQGAWFLVDNGYLAWSTTVPPIKMTNSHAEIQFSAWLESMRKDVECTFGILKGRWKILKTGIRLFGTQSADKIFLTCCALHNWLLEIDGLNERWADGIPSKWEGPLGENENDVPDASRAILNLQNPAHARSYGTSVSAGDDDKEPAQAAFDTTNPIIAGMDHQQQRNTASSIQVVRYLTLDEFRKRLVTHVNIAFHRNELQWPRRLGGHELNYNKYSCL
jgi:hypothetical protein